jgi:hypothetical protein
MRSLRCALLALVAALLLATTVPRASAWGPNTHMWITGRALEDAGDTPITRIVRADLDAFHCGLISPDIAVVHYYTSFESYKSTHSWSFLQELSKLAKTESEKAFVHGVALHLVQDAYTHNYFIPRKIAATQIQNAFIHPLVEAAVETHHLVPETMGSLAYIDRYLGLINQATGRDWTAEANFLKVAVAGGRFYDTAYTVPEADPLWNLYRALAAFVGGLVDVSDAEADLDLAYRKSVEYLRYGAIPPLDPSGSSGLGDADSKLSTTTWILRGAFMAVSGLVIYRFVLRRGKR